MDECKGFSVIEGESNCYCTCGGEIMYSHRSWMCSKSGVKYPIPIVRPKIDDPIDKHEVWSFDVPQTISESCKAIHCISELLNKLDLTHNQQMSIAEWFYVEYGNGVNR